MSASACKSNTLDHHESATEGSYFTTSTFDDTPNYECYRTEPQLQIPDHCKHKGGVHLSWIQYCSLCLVILSMGFVITVWVAVALTQSTSIVALADGYLSSMLRSLPQVDVSKPVQPNFMPTTVIETVHTMTVTTTFITEDITMADDTGTTILRSSDGSAMHSSNSSAALATSSTTSFVSVFTTSHSSSTSSSTSNPPTPAISTKWVLTTMTTSSSHLPIRPTTKHFVLPKDRHL